MTDVKEIKVKLDEPFKIIVTDSDGIEYFQDQYEFDSTTLMTFERGGSAELWINPFTKRGLKKIQIDLVERT